MGELEDRMTKRIAKAIQDRNDKRDRYSGWVAVGLFVGAVAFLITVEMIMRYLK